MILLRSGLVLHIMGIVLMAGGAVAAFVLQRPLWNLILSDKGRARLLVSLGSRLKMLQIAGAVLVVTGGIMMMAALHGVVMNVLWFRVKLVLLGLIIVNEVIMGKPAGKRLRALLATGASSAEEEIVRNALRGRMQIFYVLQFLFFLLIFILSVFQPG